MSRGSRRASWPLVAAAAAGGVAELVRRHRAARATPRATTTPPLTTQSSPGQIADLQQAYGADMAPRPGTDGSPG